MKYNSVLTPLNIKQFSTSANCYKEDSTSFSLSSIYKYAKYTYENPISQRNVFQKDLKGKSGIYCWFNIVNGKYYIGSGTNLNNRLGDYYQDWYYKEKANLYIVRAIIKYGMENFALLILDITNEKDTLIQEQHWIDKLNPEYNILKDAGNSKGYKHSIESIELMRQKAIGRKHSEEVVKAMSSSRKGDKGSFFGHKHSEETISKIREMALNRTKSNKPSVEVEVFDLKTNTTIVYSSIRKAANELDTHMSTLFRREQKSETKPFRGRYVITIKRS